MSMRSAVANAVIDRWVLCSSTAGSGAGQEDEQTFVEMGLMGSSNVQERTGV